MLALAVGGVVFFRFLWHAPLAELFSWALFLVLEVGPKMYVVPGGGSMFDTVSWHCAAKVWEAVVYNPVVDMDVAAPILLGLAAAAVVWVRVRRCVSPPAVRPTATPIGRRPLVEPAVSCVRLGC